MRRAFFGISFLVLVFFLPWWLSAIIGVLMLVEYENFFEIIIAAFITDTLYGMPIPSLLNIPLVLTISALLLYILRRKMTSYLFNPRKAF